jgi:hypothetical protein
MQGQSAERLYIFESPIDCMSHASIVNTVSGNSAEWLRHNRLSLSGTSETALISFLNQHERVTELVFCLDNDKAGREAAMLLSKKYADEGYSTRIVLPRGKDFNDDLLEYRKQHQLERNRLAEVSL